MARQAVPGPLYVLMGNLGWMLKARRHGALRRLNDRPYPFSNQFD